MEIIVCVKQVPDAKDVRLDPVTNTLAREGVESILNPYDQHALEAAVTLKEQCGGQVTVITMGPPQRRKCCGWLFPVGRIGLF
jgi:electron transfer flavoprotein beta subunit